MKENQSSMSKENKRLIGIVLLVPILLLIRLFSTLFTNEGEWDVSDFVIGGILLLIAGLIVELILRKAKTAKLRVVLFSLFFAFILVWGELAVGIFGTPFAGS